MTRRKKVVITEKKKKKKFHHQIIFHQLDWLEWIAIGVGLFFLFVQKPYVLLFTILLVIPIIGLILNGLNKPSIASLVEIDLREDKYDVADFIDVAAFCILVRVLIDFNFVHLSWIIYPSMIAFVGILILLFLTHERIKNSNKSNIWIYTAVIFNLLIYSFAATSGINCVFDNSAPYQFELEIIDVWKGKTRRSRGKYYVRFKDWNNPESTRYQRISEEKFHQLESKEFVIINRKDGLLGIPWFYVH